VTPTSFTLVSDEVVLPAARSRTLMEARFRRILMLPTNGGQSDQALVDSSKASGATYSMVEWRRWRL
jgi:hypothetical protein